MALGKRLISTGGVAVCTTDTADVFGDSSGVALYNLDYDASDASGNYDGTPTDVEFGVGGQINYGASFNGSSSYVDVSSFSFGSDNLSISMWINPSSTQNAYANIIDFNQTNTSKVGVFAIQQDASNTNQYQVWQWNGSSYNISNSVTLSADTWNHLVYTLQSNGNYVLYLNGTSSTSGSNLTASTSGVTETLNIGRWYNNGGSAGRYFNGDIDQVRIFSKALSSDEVDELFAETACVYTCTTDTVNYPSGTTPVAYYKLDNSSEDYSTGGNDGTDTDIEYRFGRFGQAAVFNGSSSAIDGMTNSYVFDNTNKRGSLSFWVNFASLSTTQALINRWDNRSGDNSVWGLWYVNGSDYLQFTHRDSSNNNTVATSNTSLFTINTWHHISLVWNQSTITFYVDSLEEGTVTNSNFNDTLDTAAGELTFGATRRTSPLHQEVLNGSLDQVRIYSTALTSSQVTELYEEKPCADTSNFKTVLYEGNGTTNYISNVGMDLETDGGLVWVKSRDTAYHHRLVDSVRGLSTDGVLFSNRTNAAEDLPSATDNFTSFDKNGFTLGSTSSTNGSNFNGDSFVAWVWKGGGDAVTGSSSQATNVSYSANQDAGFSIVKFTSSTSTSTPPPMNYISHGLNSPVEMTIYKRLDTTQNWVVQHKDLDQAQAIYLDLSNAAGTPNTTYSFFDNTSQTGNIGVRSNFVISRGQPYIAYCFHSVAGYSKIGSYTGNLSGVSVTTGFNPSFVMIKRSDSTGNWFIYDSARSNGDTFDDFLHPNLSAAETTNNSTFEINATATGFNVVGAGDGQTNASGGTFIYMAFA